MILCWLLCLVAIMATLHLTLGVPPSAYDLRHCLSSCGDVDITYPFGVGARCSRPGFELICNTTTKPPKLFFGDPTTAITGISKSGSYVQASVVFNIATTPGVLRTYSRSWNVPRKNLKTMDDFRTILVILGCGIDVHLFDGDANVLRGYCRSECTNLAVMEKTVAQRPCNGMGCCTIALQDGVRSFRFTVTQVEEQTPVVGNATIKAFLIPYQESPYEFKYSTADLLSDKINARTIGATSAFFIPIISDQPNCKVAQSGLKNSTYACHTSDCWDEAKGRGYTCFCSDNFDYGNPYLVNGCSQGTP
uniref:Wall-associated receptor kinase galacturonan-binding domain-containing protein n=1 Tax=Oryza punctata TaxID=4537 RepID=A0A0E0JIU7_ORYPU